MSEQEKNLSRRSFMAIGGGVIGSLAALTGCQQQAPAPQPATMAKVVEAPLTAHPMEPPTKWPQDEPYLDFRMGVQSYCFRDFKTIDELIGKVKELNLAHVEIWPDGHLPVTSPKAQVQEAVDKIRSAGIDIDACGVVDFSNDEAAARNIFEYAKMLGVLAISSSPQPGSLQLVDRLAREYNMPVAIHNHGPEDPIFGSIEQVRTAMTQTSNMVGFCVDLGHFYRAGVDPMLAIDEFANRVYGIHLKDLVKGEDGKWKDVVVGTGFVNLEALFDKLEEIGFKGYLSLEYEADPKDPIPAMQGCLEKVRAAAAAVKSNFA